MGAQVKHDAEINSIGFSRSGRLFATASFDGTVHLFDIPVSTYRDLRFRFEKDVDDVAFSTEGLAIAFASERHVYLKSLSDFEGNSQLELDDPMIHESPVRSLSFTPDGRSLVTVCHNGNLQAWNTSTKELLWRQQQEGMLYAIAISHDNRFAISASRDKNVRMWRVMDGAPLDSPINSENDVNAIAFAKDGRSFATGHISGMTKLWTANSGQLIGRPIPHSLPVVELEIASDGQLVVTKCSDGSIRLWDGLTGMLRREGLEHDEEVGNFAFSPSGELLVAGSSYGQLYVWDTQSGRLRGNPIEHVKVLKQSIQNVDSTLMGKTSFSPDGKLILTSCADGSVRKWDSGTLLACGQPLIHKFPATKVVFNPNGRHFATISYLPIVEGEMRIWGSRSSLDGSPAQIGLSIEVRTSLTIENGRVRSLTKSEWMKKCAELSQQGGECLIR